MPERNGVALDALAERYWKRQLQRDYFLRAQLGLPVETIRPLTYAHADSDATFAQGILDELTAIDEAALDHDRWLTQRTLHWLATNDVANRTHYWLRQEATPYAAGGQISFITSILSSFQFAGADDAHRYESLLDQYGTFIESMRELLVQQHRRGIVLPNVEIDAAQAVFEGYAQPNQTDALVPDEARLERLAPSQRSAFRSNVRRVADERIAPAFQAVAEYLRGQYRHGALDVVGLSQYPGGAEYYRYLVVANTTHNVEPERLHAMGLEIVAELNDALDTIRSGAAFSGDLAAFKSFLSSDPQFFVKTPQDFGERLERYVARAAAAVSQYFVRVPKAPYGVEPLPKELAAAQTFGYYRQPTVARPQGTYLYNAWRPEGTPALSAGALICHELIPGHHFQIALQQENTALCNLRRYDFGETGFVEGWGEYAATLGWEMGVYESSYDKAGRIMQDLMVSVRLVVDTGMNALGWSRERAMHYMREHLTLTQSQIESESLRYATDIPAQALSYKTGERAIVQLRAHARERLGAAFDVRRFHGWVLDSGSMTLDTLRAHVDYEIDAQRYGFTR